MGFVPQQINHMSVWQFEAALEGYIAANSSAAGTKLTDSEADELFDWLERDAAAPTELQTQTYSFDRSGRLAPAGVVRFDLTR